VEAIIQAPADPASFKAVVDKALAKGIPVVNDGSPQPKMPGVVPFIGMTATPSFSACCTSAKRSGPSLAL
jgi:ABC-type sugar transport system substrate-binding protein